MFLQCVTTSLLMVWILPGQAVTTETTVEVQSSILLHDAVRQGKVKVEVKSLGRAHGAGVRVEVERLVAESLRIEVAPGTVLINAQGAEQNVTVGQLKGEFTRENMYKPGQVMVLVDGRRRSFLLDIYCLDYAKKTPKLDGKLDLALLDQRVARILNAPAGVQPTEAAVQIAIWMDRAGITAEEARKRFRGKATDVDVRVATQLLQHAEEQGVASIPEGLPASVRVHVSQLFSADPEARKQAADAIGGLGVKGLPAVPYMLENLLDLSTDKPLPPSVVGLNEPVKSVADMLAQLRIPALEPIVTLLRQLDIPAGPEGAAALANITDTELSTIEQALRAAGDVVAESLVDRWIGMLGSDKPMARQRAARFLGNSGNQRAVEPLIKALEDDNEQVRAAAADALQKITDQKFGTDVNQWREWLKNR